MKQKKSIIAIVIIFLILSSSITFFYLQFFSTKYISSVGNKKNSISDSYRSVTVKIPAVDNNGNGIITKLEVQKIPGEGRTLVNVDNLLFWVDTQYSIRTAKTVAENITSLDLSNIDLVYTIETNASVIEGQSAGAALTIATIAVIQNKSLNPNVIITGTVDSNGEIGAVGGILAKANASKNIGANLFLLPLGQGTETNYKPIQKCERLGPVTFCKTEYKETKVDISKNVGIEVKEVSDIKEALKYFLT
jgi:uncharacterized protein